MHDRSFTGKRWQIQNENVSISSAHDIIAALIEKRGVQNNQTKLTPPNVYPDMERAVQRIRTAIERGERIALFGDYDCDGITAIAQLVRFFRRYGVEPAVRLPHRVNDGYGLREPIVEEMIAHQVDLLITADTGISSTKEIAMLKEHGVETIVTDHHRVPDNIPDAIVLHPALAPNHPEPHPSGAGVALQLVRALEDDAWDDAAIDCILAMIGTVADLVELKGDNRLLVMKGLRLLNTLCGNSDHPVLHLAASVRNGGALTATDIAFRIAPRINAAGRMDDPTIALRALLEGGEALRTIEKLNTERQNITRTFVDDVTSSFEGETLTPLLCAVDAEYPHGILGLIAGQLTEKYGRPSLVATIDDGICTASLRSPPGYNIAEGLNRAADLLGHFGGHAQAAGCSFPLENLSALQTRLNADIATELSEDDLVPQITADMMLNTQHVSLALCEQLVTLEPFGQGNSEPRFILQNVQLEDVKIIGSDATHLQGFISGCKAVGFSLASLEKHLSEPVDVLVRLGVNEWNNTKEPQIFIEDIRAAHISPVAV